MKIAFFCFAATLGLFAQAAVAQAATRVFLMAGQSNMAGLGGYTGYLNYAPWNSYNGQTWGADAPCPAPYNQPYNAVKFWSYGPEVSPGDHWTSASVGTGWIDLQNGYGSSNEIWGPSFGPELSFGRRLKEIYPNDNIYFVKYAINSTSLAGQWNPNGGSCYSMFSQRVNSALANLTIAGQNPTIAGMIWMQGEDDSTNINLANAYHNNLASFVSEVRSDFDAPSMKFVAGRITWMPEIFGSHAGVAAVRNAQETISGYIPNSSWIDTDDLELACYEHYGTQGQIDLGIRFANQFAVPEPSSIAMTAAGFFGLLAFAWRKRK
jgi:hypothetical protein